MAVGLSAAAPILAYSVMIGSLHYLKTDRFMSFAPYLPMTLSAGYFYAGKPARGLIVAGGFYPVVIIGGIAGVFLGGAMDTLTVSPAKRQKRTPTEENNVMWNGFFNGLAMTAAAYSVATLVDVYMTASGKEIPVAIPVLSGQL